MSHARTVWDELDLRRVTAAKRRRSGLLLAILLLGAMTVAEALFLRFVAGPDSVAAMQAAEAINVIQ